MISNGLEAPGRKDTLLPVATAATAAARAWIQIQKRKPSFDRKDRLIDKPLVKRDSKAVSSSYASCRSGYVHIPEEPVPVPPSRPRQAPLCIVN
jgi:hypothetical protein